MRITSKGQVTIPLEIRQRAGLAPHMEVEFVIEDCQHHVAQIGKGHRPRRCGRCPPAAGAATNDSQHRRDIGSDPRRMTTRILVDSNILLDVITSDPRWQD